MRVEVIKQGCDFSGLWFSGFLWASKIVRCFYTCLCRDGQCKSEGKFFPVPVQQNL